MIRGDVVRFAAVALLVLQAGLVAALPGGALFSGEEGIVRFQAGLLWQRDRAGGNLDPGGEFLPPGMLQSPDGARAARPTAMPMLSSIPYLVAGPRGLHLLPIVGMLICLAASARLAGRALAGPDDPRGSWAAAAGVGAVLATPVVFHGATILEHAPAAALATAALLPLAKHGKAPGLLPARSAAASGLLLGLAAWLSPGTALMFPALVAGWTAVAGLSGAARLAPALAAGGAAVLLPASLHARAATGSWLPPGMPWPAAGRAPAWDQAASLLLPGSARWLCAAAIALACGAALPGVRRLLASPSWGRWPAVAGGAATSLLLAAGPGAAAVALAGQSVAAPADHLPSLIQTVPVVALAPLILLIPGATLPPVARLVAWTAALYTGFTAVLAPGAGASWGAPALLAAAPLMVIGVVAAVAASRRRPGGRLAVAGLCVALAAGAAVQTIGLRSFVARASSHAEAVRRVERAVPEGDAILTDRPAVAQLLAPLSDTRPVLWVRPGSDLDLLMARIEEADVTPFWIAGEEGPAPVFAGLSRGRETRVGGGLRLLRFQQEAGVRGFARLPKGD